MWESENQVLDALEKEAYVFLRKPQSIGNESGDWDILCENIDDLVKKLNAFPYIDNGICFNYYIRIKELLWPIDIRCVGDGYFDSTWQRNMLRTRCFLGKYFVLDTENKKYTMLYHSLLQKSASDSIRYKRDIEDTFGVCDLNINIRQLASYMKEKGYYYETPIDTGVYVNEENLKMLMEVI